MRRIFYLIVFLIGFLSFSYAYELIVDVKNKADEEKLRSLYLTNCSRISGDEFSCLRSPDINYLNKLKNFLISYGLKASVSGENLKPNKSPMVAKPVPTIHKKSTQHFVFRKSVAKKSVYKFYKNRNYSSIRHISSNKHVKKHYDVVVFLNNKSIKQKNKTQENKVYKVDIFFNSNKEQEQNIYKQSSSEKQNNSLGLDVKRMYDYFNAGDIKRARDIANKLINSKYNLDAKFVLGLINLREKHFKQACNIFKSIAYNMPKAEKLMKDSCYAYYIKHGYKNLNDNNIGLAIKDFKKAIYYKNTEDAKFGLFYAYLKNNDIDKANNVINDLRAFDPENPKVKKAYLDFLVNASLTYKKEHKDYLDYISKAYKMKPKDFDIAILYFYALINNKNFKQAKRVLDKMENENLNKEQIFKIHQAKEVLYTKLASYYLNKKEYTIAKKYALKGLKISENPGLLEILGWSCYNLKEYNCSEKAFKKAIYLDKNQESLKLGLMYTYFNKKELNKALEIANQLKDSNDPKTQEAVKTVYFTIAKIYGLSGDITKNIKALKLLKAIKQNQNTYKVKVMIKELNHKIKVQKQKYTSYLEVGIKFRAKSGQSGESKLTDTSPYVMAKYFINQEFSVYAGSYYTYLNSGALSDYTTFGTPSNVHIIREVPSSYSGAEPFAGFKLNKEHFELKGSLGTTPFVNNGISPAVVYSLEGYIKKDDDKIGVGVYRKPIRDSILSYVGNIDPYTKDGRWGRAVENGVKISFLHARKNYYVYSNIEQGQISGENIENNTDTRIILMPMLKAGKLIGDKDYVGMFLMYQSFSKYQDCYLYGCGGYFSPKTMIIASPTIEGYKFFDKNLGIHYRASLGGLYLDNNNQKSLQASFDGYIGGVYRLNDNMTLNIGTDYRRTSNYDEFFSTIYLDYFFGTRYNIIQEDLDRQEKNIYKK